MILKVQTTWYTDILQVFEFTFEWSVVTLKFYDQFFLNTTLSLCGFLKYYTIITWFFKIHYHYVVFPKGVKAGPWEARPVRIEKLSKPCPPCQVSILVQCLGKHEVRKFINGALKHCDDLPLIFQKLMFDTF